jgi:hypothetical protein
MGQYILPADYQTFIAGPIRDPLPIGREARTKSFAGDFVFCSAEGRNDVNSASIAVGPERDLAAIWRKGRLAVVGFVVSDSDGFSARELLNPYVQVISGGAIGGVGNQLAVG